MVSTNLYNLKFGYPRSHLLRFCKVLKRLVFWLVWGSATSWPKISKIGDFGSQLDFGRYIWEGSAGEAWCQGGERGGVIENGWLRLQELIVGWVFKIVDCVFSFGFSTPLRRGGRIYGLLPLPPTSDLSFICYCVFMFGIVGLWVYGVVSAWVCGLVFRVCVLCLC